MTRASISSLIPFVPEEMGVGAAARGVDVEDDSLNLKVGPAPPFGREYRVGDGTLRGNWTSSSSDHGSLALCI